jgi:UDP-glucose 4-epimerase
MFKPTEVVTGGAGFPDSHLCDLLVKEGLKIPGRIDYISHFASPANPNDYLNYPIQTLKVGSPETHRVLGSIKENKARFLLASTSEVYGYHSIHLQGENYRGNINPIGHKAFRMRRRDLLKQLQWLNAGLTV